MTEISQRYARLADAFTAKIAAVPDDRWACPSPCEGWTARDVVCHVIGSQEMFLGMVGRASAQYEGFAGSTTLGRVLASSPSARRFLRHWFCGRSGTAEGRISVSA
jgi:uncharacterized protein (TIGR03083 family)